MRNVGAYSLIKNMASVFTQTCNFSKFRFKYRSKNVRIYFNLAPKVLIEEYLLQTKLNSTELIVMGLFFYSACVQKPY